MAKQTPSLSQRKSLHLAYALKDESQSGSNGLDAVTLPYNSLPELSLKDISLATTFLGKKVGTPFFISCMTGGPQKAGTLNKRLAIVAQKYNIPMGLGSMKIILKDPSVLPTFQVRRYAPDIVLMANLGAVSLNYGLTWKECQRVVDLVEADALVLHLNPLQESLQLGGDTDFSGLARKIGKVAEKITVPVIVKEVGHGIGASAALKLFDRGVRIIDTAGCGGTSWAWIEAMIAEEATRAEVFKDYGISTYDSIVQCKQIKGLTVLGSGGIRTGLDIVKVLYLGCSMAGLAWPFMKAALESEEALDTITTNLIEETKIAMFCSGVRVP